ncbi:folylpolyglutamate synthetase [Trypanosoma theileri]|uniref:tetrahydrofolate synthase n=1 Tax=Trypanosoma theileri TaxID=67003 RepID=A0A1X0NM42_9TRYP|nr:folylpolyglutamate synthetase [Trypanosoma theileri]ORC85219.1 folylpolyglutamate synthetase [Trypanosoma theileri]
MNSLSPSAVGRTFADVLRSINILTGGKPNPCPNNLEATMLLLDRLNMRGHMEKLRFVHVAGTKGKGTTSAYTSALLQSYGLKVGLFTSPHIVDVRERIMVNNALLSKELFTRYFFEMQDRYTELMNSESQLSRDIAQRSNFFRFMFVLSLHIFVEEAVDVAVMEVGMGGRLDATNAISPDVCVITALGLDHTEILGNSIEEIALEKAGIMKPGVICYTAPQKDHLSTIKVLEMYGHKVGAPVVVVDEHTLPIRNWPSLAIGGSHAIEDSKLALLAARRIAGILPTLPLSEVERNVLQTMTFAGRSQVLPFGGESNVIFYLDGAHTYESLRDSTHWFMEESCRVSGDPHPRRILVFYTSRDPHYVLKGFMPYVSGFCKVIVAQIFNPRTSTATAALTAEERAKKEMVSTTECWRELYREVPCISCTGPFDSIQELIDLCNVTVNETEDTSKSPQIFITGSFFLVADIMNLIIAKKQTSSCD